MKTKIFIDTDLGDDIDDAYALALALSFEDTELLGITTVFKNTKQRAYIAKRLMTLAGKGDIEVHAGINKPLNQEAGKFDIEDVGDDNLPILRHYDDKCLDYPYDGNDGIDFMLKAIKENPNEVILFGIGPVTNIAAAIQKDPQTMKLVKQIVLMNGFFKQNDAKEWNVLCDPEATKIVYSSGIPVKAVGANCTRLVEITNNDLSTIENLRSPAGRYLASMLRQWRSDNSNRNPIMHDALALITIVHDYCKYENEKVIVPLDESRRGCIVTDESGYQIDASVSVDVNGFVNDFVNRLTKLDKELLVK